MSCYPVINIKITQKIMVNSRFSTINNDIEWFFFCGTQRHMTLALKIIISLKGVYKPYKFNPQSDQ